LNSSTVDSDLPAPDFDGERGHHEACSETLDAYIDLLAGRSLSAASAACIGEQRLPGPRKGVTPSRPHPVLGRFVRGSLGVSSRISLRRAHAIGGVLGRLFARLPTRDRRWARTSLEIAFPEMTATEREELLRGSFAEMGRTILELGGMWSWPAERVVGLVRETTGEHLLHAAAARGRGILILSPHLGPWELLLQFLSSCFPVTIPYRAPRLRELETFVRAARERSGATLVPAGGGAVRHLLRTLRSGGCVALAPDQDAGEGSGVFVPLFHEVANTGVLAPRLAARSGATVLWAVIERLPEGAGYRLHFTPADPDICGADVVRAAAAVNRDIERWVRRFPQLWLWAYRRWRIRPKGLRDPYRR